ncbi:MAG: hypothetical protein ABIP06_04680 [Pyrinomonadaceae bacterium]
MPKLIKKEFVSLLQFVLIAIFVGYGYFGLLLLQRVTVLSLWGEYEHMLIKWIFSFTVLSVIRFAGYYFYLREKPYDLTHQSSKNLIGKEFSSTFQYIIFAVISIPIAFYIEISSHFDPDISLNIGEWWRSFEGAFLEWLIGFSVLSLLRLGIIYIKNKSFLDKYAAKT